MRIYVKLLQHPPTSWVLIVGEHQTDGCARRALTLALQAPLPVGFHLCLAQVLGVLVLKQRSFPLQLPQRGLNHLPAAHLEEDPDGAGEEREHLGDTRRPLGQILTSLSSSLTSLSRRLVAFLKVRSSWTD